MSGNDPYDGEAPPSFQPGTGRRLPPSDPVRPPRRTSARPAAGPEATPVPQDGRLDPTRAMPVTPARVPVTGTSGAAASGRSVHPGSQPPRPAGPPGSTRPPRRPSRATYRRRRLTVLALVLVLLLAWPVGLVLWANGRIQHVEALTGALDTTGTTYLIAGSDSRADGAVDDPTEGARTDTIMLLTKPADGVASLVSIPRDSVVEVPGHGLAKINAAYAYGGPTSLVATVEGLTGIGIDHYVEIGMGGVEEIVDAVGGIELCWDADVSDRDSGMEWVAGCHEVDGTQALAFARMRKSDPTGDIGRGLRQQQVVQAVVSALQSPSLLLPTRQVSLIRAGTDALVTDPGTGILSLGQMALAFRAATGEGGFRGTPYIADADYRGAGLGSSVLLDEARNAQFWRDVVDGTLPTAAESQTTR
ncbi:LCP family protein [Serinibacter salmoneus]|uniref:LytR family transcriptional attenuator n=1 Tax=Serinibacter salmoneus TaxID=556530 RepID=A0A2A9D0Z7_9MICO|nr:LCP family protein [Serinibacter salmoneus]PFG20368.1 LytR family transcriptional attenuator [Serinibacter salmoneus]